MEYLTFAATCPFKLGDKVKYEGKIKTITDICCMNYERNNETVFTYALDNSQHYTQLAIISQED